jgi:hypothetical protein
MQEGDKGIENDGDDLQGDRQGALQRLLLRRHVDSFAGGGGRVGIMAGAEIKGSRLTNLLGAVVFVGLFASRSSHLERDSC